VTTARKPKPRLDFEASFDDLSEKASERSEQRFAAPSGIARAERASALVQSQPSAFPPAKPAARPEPPEADDGEPVPLFDATSFVTGKVYRVPIALIDPNAYGARVYYRASDVDRISLSMTKPGGKQEVAAHGWVKPDGRVELFDGGTRLRAGRSSGLDFLDVKIEPPPSGPREQYKRSRALNEERSAQTALDLAVQFRKLLDDGVYASQDELAADQTDSKGNPLSKAHVSMYLRIDRIPERLRKIMIDHEQTTHFTIAYEISALFTADDYEARKDHYDAVGEEVIREVQTKNLGKQQVIELVRSKLEGPKSRTRPDATKVRVGDKQGVIKVFESRGQLDFSIKGLDEATLRRLVEDIQKVCEGQLPLVTR
jgi:ParB family chromosome partitioning protein